MEATENRKLKAQIVLMFGSQGEFADRMGRDQGQLSQIINRGLIPHWLDAKEKKRWARALKCKVGDIF